MYLAILLLVSLGGVSLVLLTQERDALDAESRARAESAAQSLALHCGDSLTSHDRPALTTMANETATGPGVLYAIVTDDRGIVWGANDPSRVGKPYDPGPGRTLEPTDSQRIVRGVDESGQPALDVAFPVEFRAGEKRVRIGAVYVGLSQQSIHEAARKATGKAVLAVLVFVLAGLGTGAALVTVAARPVSVLVEGARKIGRGEFGHLVDVPGNDELAELADAMNAMAASLESDAEGRAARERLQQELELARNIQESLIPRQRPDVSGFSFGMHYRPAREVGGDYFDFLSLPNGVIGIVMADVSGKGLPAALVMTAVRSALRAAAAFEGSPDRLLARLNRLFYGDLQPGMFVAAWIGALDPSRAVLRHATAGSGNVPLLHFRATEGRVFSVTPASPCFPLGLGAPSSFEQRVRVEELPLASGDALVLCTDGVSEAMNTDARPYGTERLIAAIAKRASSRAEDLVKALADDVAAYTAGAEPSDDLAIVALRVN